MSAKPLRSRFVLPLVSVAASLLPIAAVTGCTGGEAGSEMRTSTSGEGGDDGDSGTGGERGDGGSASTTSPPGATTGGDGGAGSTASVTASASASSTVTSVTASSSTGGPEQVAEVFAHSADTLYRVDLVTNEIETIGDFSGCGGIIDIALDKDSQMYGTTFGYLYRIDRTTAVCTEIADGSFPNSLSFVPAGTLDPNTEQLVGYVDDDYVRIDTVSGQVTTILSNALTGGRISSGDIVSVIDGPTLLTVKGGGCDDADCVVSVDPVTGQIVDEHGTAAFDNVFGVAFWDGSLYGFTSYGDAFELVPDGAGGFDPLDIPFAQTVQFYGAGSTTSAPKGILN
jgi:hypothetical protein